jgi:hypothetical protein
MFTQKDFAYFRGIVQEVTFREKVHAATTSGGGFIFRGTGFVAPPSVSIQSHSVQDFWLKGAQGERNFQIFGSSLPMREGQPLAALWLKGRYAGYANHATNQYLLLDNELSAAIGRKPKTTAFHTLIPFLCMFSVAFFSSIQMASRSISHAAQNTWAMIFCLSVLAAFVFPVIGSIVGCYRNCMHAQRERAVIRLVKRELNSLLACEL